MKKYTIMILVALLFVSSVLGEGVLRNSSMDDYVRLDKLTETARHWRPERISGMSEFYAVEHGAGMAQAITADQPFNATLTNEVHGVAPGVTYTLSVDALLDGGVARVGIDDTFSEWITDTNGWSQLSVSAVARSDTLNAILQASGDGAHVYFDNAILMNYESKILDGYTNAVGFKAYLPFVN